MTYGGNDVNQRNTISNETVHLKTPLENSIKSVSSLETMKDIEKSKEEYEAVDGGYGWLVVFGSFMVQITSFGVISSWGVMQDYYHQHLFDSDPQALVNLSFVGSLALTFSYLPSPVVQVCTSIFGVRPIMIAGSLMVVVGMEMAGFSTKIWHLYLTQGIVFGTGASCMYVNVMAITPQWFTKNRGIALGIVAGGSGIGGLVVPLIYTAINQKLGPGWTYRIMGFVCLFCNILACIFVKDRIPRKRKRLSEIIQLDVLKNFNFVLFSIASDIALLGYFIPFFFVPSYATWLGLSDSQGSSLVSVLSAMNFIGRLVAGILADRIGHLNTNVLFTLISAISVFLIWVFAYTYSTLMGFVVVFGFSCGSYFALMSNISANLLGMEQLPSGLSFLFIFNVISVFGTNISSAIEAGVTSEPYFSYKMFAGVTFILGTLLLVLLRFRISKNIFIKI